MENMPINWLMIFYQLFRLVVRNDHMIMNDKTEYDRKKGSCTVLVYYPCPYVGALRNTTCYITRTVLASSRTSASPRLQCKIGKIHNTCSVSQHKMSTTALGVDQSAVPNKRKHGSELVETKPN
jgi:hypothetical protein